MEFSILVLEKVSVLQSCGGDEVGALVEEVEESIVCGFSFLVAGAVEEAACPGDTRV